MAAGAGPVEDPNDPETILRDLPERERTEFLRQYHQAVAAAHDPAGYRRLQHLLHVWRLTVIAAGRSGYYEAIDEVLSGRAQTTPADEAIPGWQELLAEQTYERRV
jgi:hypothetical protein